MPGVGLLVGQHVAQALLAPNGSGGQVDGGAQDAKQAGGVQPGLHHIHRVLTAGNFHAHPVLAQPRGEGQVGPHQPQGHPRRPGQPDRAQDLCQGPLLCRSCTCSLRREPSLGFDRFRAGNGGLLPTGGGRCQAGGGDLRSLQPGGDGLPRRFRHGQHADIQRGQGDGGQQPHQHQGPQGVLHPAGDLLPERPAQDQQPQDQHGGRQQYLSHVFLPPAFSRMADSSAISSSDSPRLSTMALIIRPTLPP